MKKFFVNCDFNGQKAPFSIYIGVPEGSHHPLHFQADWLGKNRGGSIPPDVMDAISQLKNLAEKNRVSLEDLCVYALGAAQQGDEPEEEQEFDEDDIDFDDEVSLGSSDDEDDSEDVDSEDDEDYSKYTDEMLDEAMKEIDEETMKFLEENIPSNKEEISLLDKNTNDKQADDKQDMSKLDDKK